jgi:hypothetical protein
VSASLLQEDPDLALAKMLQAQEQAWLAMAGQGSAVLENVPPGGVEPGAGPRGANNDGIDAEGEALTDEEMARRLQQEEELEFQQRLLALAGVGPPGAPEAIGEGPPEGVADEGDDYLDEAVDPDELTYEQVRVAELFEVWVYALPAVGHAGLCQRVKHILAAMFGMRPAMLGQP